MAASILRAGAARIRNGITIFNHVRYKYCTICNVEFNAETGRRSIGIDNCTKLWIKYSIACNPYQDKVCNGCSNITNAKIINCTNVGTYQISNMGMGKKAMDNVQRVLSAVTSEYRSMQEQQMSNTAEDHTYCKISIGTVSNDECDTLTKISLRQFTDIGTSIISEMKDSNLNISKCLLAIDKQHKDDNIVNEINWVYRRYGDESVGNRNYQNSDSYLLAKIRKYLFYFFVKSVTTNSFDIMAIYHKRHEQTVRRYFHRGRVLLHHFWMPKHNAISRITPAHIEHHQNPYTTVLNQILNKKVFGCFDGHELRQDRYRDFNASYLSYSYKKYNTRKWMGIVLYVIYLFLSTYYIHIHIIQLSRHPQRSTACIYL